MIASEVDPNGCLFAFTLMNGQLPCPTKIAVMLAVILFRSAFVQSKYGIEEDRRQEW